MKDKRVIGYFAAGLLTAAALYGIYVLVHPMTSGDDEPIVVAGGSFDIGSRRGFDPPPAGGNHHQTNHKETNRTVNRVEILYNDQKDGPGYQEFDVNGDLTVGIEYFPANQTEPHDKVTLSAAKGRNLTISNDPACPPIGDEVVAGSTKIIHKPLLGSVNQITVTGKLNPQPKPFYPCDDGKCQVVLHYWCSSIVVNACK